MKALPPEASIDPALGEIEDGLSVSSLRTELRSLYAHLRFSERTLPLFGEDGASPSERLLENLRQARRGSAASPSLDRPHTTEKTTGTDPELARDRQEAEKKTEEEDRSLSQDEDTGISIM